MSITGPKVQVTLLTVAMAVTDDLNLWRRTRAAMLTLGGRQKTLLEHTITLARRTLAL